MNTAMSQPVAAPHGTRTHFITPLAGDALLNEGECFSRGDLVRRILSLCWRDCCLPKSFSRAPAPVIQIASGSETPSTTHRAAAWWLLPDGIIADVAGPNSERLRPFVGEMGRTGQLWPRYEFQIEPTPANLPGEPTMFADIMIYSQPMSSNRQRIWLTPEGDSRLRITAREYGPPRR
jgi:hypothetical protein